MPQTMTSRGDRLIWLTQFQEMIFIFVNGPQTFQGIWKYCLWSSLLKTTTFLCFSPKFVCMAARNSQIFHFWGVRVWSFMGEWGWVFISYWPLLLFLTCYKAYLCSQINFGEYSVATIDFGATQALKYIFKFHTSASPSPDFRPPRQVWLWPSPNIGQLLTGSECSRLPVWKHYKNHCWKL